MPGSGGVLMPKFTIKYLRLISCLLFFAASAAAQGSPGGPRAVRPAAAALEQLGAIAAGAPEQKTAPLPPRPSPRSPVIVTLPGVDFVKVGIGPLNLYAMKNFFLAHFNNKKPDTQAALEKELEDLDWGAGALSAEDRETLKAEPLTDNYLEILLKEQPEYSLLQPTIIPLVWSMDPADSNKALPGIVARLEQIGDANKDSGRPVYILGHSWGSVLLHEALRRLAARRPDLKFDRFVTTGSPLVPAGATMVFFVNLKKFVETISVKVSKPANVGRWVNVWASRDIFSNAVPAADENIRIDASLEKAEAALVALIAKNTAEKPQAKKDLGDLRHIIRWHGAYYKDFKASLKSINTEIDLRVFRPVLVPQVLN